MARTVSVIKKSITTSFMANETLATAYGFTAGADFDTTFSKVSIESILCFIVATAIWTLETLFDLHVTETTNLLDTKKPHRRKWYQQKALAFLYGYSLPDDSDEYDTSALTEAEITAAQIVKFAAVVEYQGRLFIKVATGTDTAKSKLSDPQQTALEAYLAEIKDAGVRIGDIDGQTKVVNLDADHYAAEFDIYYDPMVYSSDGLRLDSGADTVRDTVVDYVQNQIPFNGEYRNSALIDVLQGLDGVVIPELKNAKTITHASFLLSGIWSDINAKSIPAAGYFKVYDTEADLTLNFIAYQTIEND